MVTTNKQKTNQYHKVKDAWYGECKITPKQARDGYFREIEEHGMEILDSEGFTDIIRMPYQFPVDAFATDPNGKRWMIDFTMSLRKRISIIQGILMKETRCSVLFLFIKPDKTQYFFKIPLTGKCVQVSVSEIDGYDVKRIDKTITNVTNTSIVFSSKNNVQCSVCEFKGTDGEMKYHMLFIHDDISLMAGD